MSPRDDEFAAAPSHSPSHSPGLSGMLVELALRQAGRLPLSLLRLPMTGLNLAMVAAEALRRELDTARSRGGGVVDYGTGMLRAALALRHGTGVSLPDAGAVDAEAAEISRTAREAAAAALSQAKQTARETALAGARASEPAREVGAPGTATVVAEEAARDVRSARPAEAPHRDDLPIADFDNATLGSLRARLRRLTLEDLVVLRDYEQAHAHRLPVLTMLENRIARVRAEQEPSGSGSGNSTAKSTGNGGSAATGAGSGAPEAAAATRTARDLDATVRP